MSRPGSELPLQLFYDLFGQSSITQTVGTGSQSTETVHDVLGRRLSEDGPLGETQYWWDAGSRLTRIIWPDAYYAEYLYDLTGAMTEVRENGATSGAGLLAQYAYDNLGRRVSVARGNGASTTYGWDGASRLTSLAIDLSGSSQDATWTLDYNPAGQVVERELSNSLFAYTANPTLSDAYTNNGLNQVTAVDSASVTYDGRGNLIQDGSNGNYDWSFDASNRLVEANSYSWPIFSYGYDPLGRLYREGGPSPRRFQYAGAQAIAEYDDSGTLVQRYVPGAGLDDYAAYTVGTGTITRQWPITDPLGSVAARSDSSAVGTINTYDEYGVPASGNSGRFGYAGSMFLTGGGPAPWHMRNRQYHPGLGRFLQTDPIGVLGGFNLYAYAENDPANLVDPFGLDPSGPTSPWPHDTCRGPAAPFGCTVLDGYSGWRCFPKHCIDWYVEGRPREPKGPTGAPSPSGIGSYFGYTPDNFGQCLGCSPQFEAERDRLNTENAYLAIPALAPVAVVGILEVPALLAVTRGNAAALNLGRFNHIFNVKHGLTHISIQAGGRGPLYNTVHAAASRWVAATGTTGPFGFNANLGAYSLRVTGFAGQRGVTVSNFWIPGFVP